MTMTRNRMIAVVAAVVFVAVMLSVSVSQSDTRRMFGRYQEISRERYQGFNGIYLTEFLVYDKTTNLVYVYTTDGSMTLSITPYLMRDKYGQITVGYFNAATGEVEPAEMTGDDSVPYDMYGKRKDWFI